VEGEEGALPEDFARIYREHYPRLVRYLTRASSDGDNAQDKVNDRYT
jgi:DNA-directed RNA polymerase specialized sigma24 family protein